MRPEQRNMSINPLNAREALGRSLVGTFSIALVVASAVFPAAAQQSVEIWGSGGFTLSEGVSVNRTTAGGEFIDKVNPTSGASFVGAVNFWLNDQVQFGVQFGRQNSAVELEGTTTREVTEMNVNNYHGIVTYNAGSSGSTVRPFFMFGVGATHYQLSEVMNESFDSEVKLSGTLGGGVKAYVSEHIGFGFTARWTPTYIKSDSVDLYCSAHWTPYWPGGCVVVPDRDFSNQLELSGGIILRL